MTKHQFGQFFTRKDWWLNDKPQIIRFIKKINKKHLVDPFSGEGHIIETCKKIIPNFFNKTTKYDVDININAIVNDSILNVPYHEDGIIITNPPYLAKVSAKRKKIFSYIEKYFNISEWNDLYKIALEKMILSGMPGIALVPESIMNSKFLVKYKSKIDLITIIILNPFEDTEIPICVVCFNGDTGTTIIYKNDEKLGLLNELEKERLKPQNNFWIKFNSPSGQIGLRAIDSSGKNKKIEFIQRDKFHYDSKKIKVSSRVMTYISIEENYSKRIDEICSLSNEFLEKYRERTKDIYLTPFKGNNKEEQRRRLDYKTARAILEEAILKINT